MMNASDRHPDVRKRPTLPWFQAGRFALAVVTVVAALAVFVSVPPPSQASHSTDGDLLSWVEAHDASDVSAGLLEALAVDRPELLRAGACRVDALGSLPASLVTGCEPAKAVGDLSELEPSGASVLAERSARGRATLARSDAVPTPSALQPPVPPPRG
jgi:hypothetical protein